jgi:hypothetical protein
MEWLLIVLPGVACGAMMLAMCLPMMRHQRGGNKAESASKEDVAALREEIARLRAERALGGKERIDG